MEFRARCDLIFDKYDKALRPSVLETLEVQDQTKNGLQDDPCKGFPTTSGQRLVFGLPGERVGKPFLPSLKGATRFEKKPSFLYLFVLGEEDEFQGV